MRQRDWGVYYAHASDVPRPTLVDAVQRFDAPGFAVDLGCGAGRDTLELLRRGWRVLALDADARGIERLREQAGDDPRLETEVVAVEIATWPHAELVNASFALPFFPPDHFDAIWARIVDSLPPGGRFAGQLFGERDGWRDDVVVHTAAEVGELLAPFDVERFDEVEEDGTIVTGARKHWHLFHVVARKR